MDEEVVGLCGFECDAEEEGGCECFELEEEEWWPGFLVEEEVVVGRGTLFEEEVDVWPRTQCLSGDHLSLREQT